MINVISYDLSFMGFKNTTKAQFSFFWFYVRTFLKIVKFYYFI